MKKSKIAKFVSILLKLLLVGGIVAIPFLPKLYNLFKDDHILNFLDNGVFYVIGFYGCFLLCLLILYYLIRVFELVYLGAPFRDELVLYLKVIAVLFMLIAGIVIIKTIFIPTLLSLAVILVTFVCSLSFYVLSQVFKVAIHYKKEIDFVV